MKRGARTDLIFVCILLLLTGVFFFRLFYPEPGLIVTPDFGRSDAWHFSFATRYALSQSLKLGTLPLWRSDLGDGFPLLAEGQTGTFFLPNLILFYLFDPVTAYNLSLMVTVFMIGSGTYLLSRMMKLSPVSSLFAGVTFMFSGLPMLQLPHITLLQSASMLPFLVAISLPIAEGKFFPWVPVFALLLSQQLFTGFPQITFLTLLLVISYAAWMILHTKKPLRLAVLIAAIAAGVAGGAAQLLPSMEFLRNSTNPGGFDAAAASYFSMPLSHLVSFFRPFWFGDPRTGTYPSFMQFDGSIFWENTAFIGWAPWLFIVYAVWKSWKQPLVRYLLLLITVSLFMAWGKHSPAYILYSFWPLTLFRVPARFLWLIALALTLLSAKGVHAFGSAAGRILFVFLILGFQILQLFLLFNPYQMIVTASGILAPMDQAKELTGGRIYTIGMGEVHNAEFLSNGWTNPEVFTRLYRTALSPNSNIFWNVDQHDVYAGRYLLRPSVSGAVFGEGLTVGTAEATASSMRYFTLFSIRHILSYVPVHSPGLIPEGNDISPDFTVYRYRNPDALPNAYLVTEATVAATLSQAVHALRNDTFIPGKTVLLESHDVKKDGRIRQFISPGSGERSREDAPSVPVITGKTMTSVDISTDYPDGDAVLVLTDTFYPGWEASLDGDRVPIMAANLSQRAIFVPKGRHQVTFTFRPKSVSDGMRVSAIVTIMLIVSLTIGPIAFFRARIPRTTHPPVRRLPRTRGT